MLAKRGVGEANTSVVLLTRELGLLRASAKSARREVSKLRYGLEALTVARFSLVRGRYEWKLVGVEKQQRMLAAPELPRTTKAALGRVSKLLLRLLQGEEPVPQLYTTVVEGFVSLAYPAGAPGASPDSVEIILVLRILAHLGYLPQTAELSPFMNSNTFSLELAASAARSRALLIRAINESLQATGL